MQSSDDPTLLRALLDRLTGGNLVIGALPERLPLDLPLPEGARVLGRVVHPGFTHPSQPDPELHTGHASVYLDAPGTGAALHSFYLDACRAGGWTVPHASLSFPTRVAGSDEPEEPLGIHAQGPDGRYLQVGIQPQPGGRCAVNLDFGAMPRGMGMRDHSDNPLSLVDTVLFRSAMPGINIQVRGGHGSDSSATQEAVAHGDLTAAEVEAAVAEQCRAAGWTLRTRGAEGPMAWSRWSHPKGDEYDAWLIVTEGPGPARSSIELRVQRTPSDDDDRHGSSWFSSSIMAFARATDADAEPATSLPPVACPRCGERPPNAAVWMCAPGCHTSWNTFNTRGRCPGCGKQWTETACLACGQMSPHEDWYRTEPDKNTD
jgi:hypothetical protein